MTFNFGGKLSEITRSISDPGAHFGYGIIVNGNRLFINSDGAFLYKTPDDAVAAIKDTDWWREITKYIEYGAEFFGMKTDEDKKNYVREHLEQTWNKFIDEGYINVTAMDYEYDD